MPPEISPTAGLRADLDRMADLLDEARFRLAVPHRDARARPARRGSDAIRRYLLPRLADPAGPLLVAVFGPTGAGKSTLVNSLAGRTVSEPGPLRPTTRRPVFWCHPAHQERALAWGDEAVLEADDSPLLEAMTIVDTPDLDSYLAEHRSVAESVLQVADAAIFVTTPQRYADAVPWEVVGDLVARGMPLVVVANRLSRRSQGAVTDLADLLRRHGVRDARADHVVQIQEHRLRSEARMPRSAVERVRGRLEEMGKAPASVIRATVSGAVSAVSADAVATVNGLLDQRDEGEALWGAAHLGYRNQIEEIALHLESGELVQSEVVARWQRIVGVTDLAALVGRGWARLKDIIRGSGPLEPDRVTMVSDEARQELVDLALVRCRRAVTAAVTAWEIEPGARALVTDDLRRVGPDLAGEARHQVDEWFAGLVTLIDKEGRGDYRLARLASVGINGAAVVLLLAVFASTGGITGGEAGVVAGAAAAQQTVLEHLFGSAAASGLARRARADLARRLGTVLEGDAARFHAAVEAALDARDLPERLSFARENLGRSARALDG